MNGDRRAGAPADGAAPADARLNEGRNYWKAAIAHLAPEKREAAWDFYLDRLESSAAADTLGGVMLLLEAHLAFFDDLPARLGQVAQQIEVAFQAPRRSGEDSTSSASALAHARPSVPRRWLRRVFGPALWATIGGATVYAAFTFTRHPSPAAPANISVRTDHLLYPSAGSIRVEPWSEPAARRPRGVIVSFGAVAWTERTPDGGAKVYVPSPVEEVRRDLEVLRGATK